MLPFAFFEGCLRLGDNLRAALTLPCPDDLFLPALVFTPSLLPLERKWRLVQALQPWPTDQSVRCILPSSQPIPSALLSPPYRAGFR
jgi:hypothetical protein